MSQFIWAATSSFQTFAMSYKIRQLHEKLPNLVTLWSSPYFIECSLQL
jgi:hypothetical protein